MPAVEGDALVTQSDQMLGRQARTGAVVHDQVVPRAIELTVEHEHGNVGADRTGHRGSIAALGRREDDPGRRVLDQGREHGLLALHRLAGTAEQGDEADRRQRFVDTGGELGEVRIGKVVDDQGDAGRRLRAQIGRRAVVDVADTSDFGLDPGARFRMHERAAAQHQRHGCARYTAASRHVVQGQSCAGLVCCHSKIWIDPIPPSVHRMPCFWHGAPQHDHGKFVC